MIKVMVKATSYDLQPYLDELGITAPIVDERYAIVEFESLEDAINRLVEVGEGDLVINRYGDNEVANWRIEIYDNYRE